MNVNQTPSFQLETRTSQTRTDVLHITYVLLVLLHYYILHYTYPGRLNEVSVR